MGMDGNSFVQSLRLERHPMQLVKIKHKKSYYIWLEYLIGNLDEHDEFISARLAQYRAFLLDKEETPKLKNGIPDDNPILRNRLMPWRNKYRYWILCDFALIVRDEIKIRLASAFIKKYLSKRQAYKIDTFISVLLNNKEIPKSISFTTYLVNQYHLNRKFLREREIRCIVTSNVSAGKSTLINAVIGKPLTKTSQEICTGNLSYLYSKPFEDNLVHLSSPVNLDAKYHDLDQIESSSVKNTASYFRTTIPAKRVCLIDTPGVNSAINKHHKNITYDFLKEEVYDILIYILNANKLGTDEEKESLYWISRNIPEEKVLFALNKLDTFNSVEDSVEESLIGVRDDLINIGYNNPIIYPISSYCGYLTKLKFSGEYMTEDELDQYELYVRKFNKEKYDLSSYVGYSNQNEDGSELIQMTKKCGLYALEEKIFGGY